MRSDLAHPGGGRSGFTLIEVLVATMLVAGIAGAATLAVGQALRARATAGARQEASSRAGAAVDRIALDVQNSVRSGDLFDARVLLVDGRTGDVDHDEMLLFAHASRQARSASAQNEGGSYEVQYRLQDPEEGRGAYVLWRRQDPVPDSVPDGGGVAAPIVEGLLSLSIEAFDGNMWHPEWDSDRDGYPHAIRILALARSEASEVTAPAGRVVGLDRTPPPIANPDIQVETGQSQPAATVPGAPRSTGAGQGGPGGGTIVTPPRGGAGGGRGGDGGSGNPGGPGGPRPGNGSPPVGAPRALEGGPSPGGTAAGSPGGSPTGGPR